MFERHRRPWLSREVPGYQITHAICRKGIGHKRRRVRDDPVEDNRNPVDGAHENKAYDSRVLQTPKRSQSAQRVVQVRFVKPQSLLDDTDLQL